MATQTGRTVNKFTAFIIGDSGNATLRSLPINSISALGVTYDSVDLTAWQDAVKGSLPNMPSAPIDISGPFDTAAAAALSALSGSHTILSAIVGATTPLTVDTQVGIRHAWESGEPQYGITGTTANGYTCHAYTVDLSSMTYSAHLEPYPASTLPAWGTTAETT